MKIDEKEIKYVEYLCYMIPILLKTINDEYKKDGYIISSENRASFNRLRIEMNKVLLKIKKEIYK